MPQNRAPGPGSPEQALLTFRIIGLSLGLGVTLFAAVSWYLNQGRTPTDAAGAGLMLNAMLAVAVGAAVAGVLFWRARVAPLIERPHPRNDWLAHAAEVQTNVIIVWALMEGAALFAEVVYFLYGSAFAGVLGVAAIWITLGLTWPKREWLGA
jgi:hypothetical protein